MLIGGHGALDFLNSVFTPADEAIDLLGSGQALGDWLQASAVLPAGLCEVVRRLGRPRADALAADARALREWFRGAVQRWASRGATALKAADLDYLNVCMAQGPLRRQLVTSPQGLALQTQDAGADAQAVLAALAALCADLLVAQMHEQVRRCENPACTLWFADNKRGPRRRWCSMAACGNRHKVAAHRARAREAGGAAGA